jgi:hypothetical protein
LPKPLRPLGERSVTRDMGLLPDGLRGSWTV